MLLPYFTETELVASLPITTGHPYNFQTVYQIEADLLEGDFIHDVNAQLQATNPYTHTVMFAHALLISKNPNATIESPDIVYLARPSGANIDSRSQIHHFTRTMGGRHFLVPEDGKYYIKVVAYAASTAGGAGLTLDGVAANGVQSYGHLSFCVLRGAEIVVPGPIVTPEEPPIVDPTTPVLHMETEADGVTTLTPAYTVIDRSMILTPGEVVSHVGLACQRSHPITPKIVRQATPSSNTFNIVWSGSPVTHPGGGHVSFPTGGFVVPEDGATYRVAFCVLYQDGADSYDFSAPGRWMKAGDITGSMQAFTLKTDGGLQMSWTEA